MELVLNETNFEAEVTDHKGVALVDFWADWCAPCRMYAPVIKQLAGDYAGRVKVGKVNVDENPNLSSRFGIMGIPTTIVFVDGEEKERLQGYNAREQVSVLIDKHLSR